MDHSKRNRTPEELDSIADALRAERHQPSPLDLDRIKLQAIRQAEQPRPSLYAVKKGTFMKSRLALTLLLVAGFMLSTTGATLAISGSSGSGSAATNQYVQPHNEEGNHGGEQGTKGVNGKGGNENNTLNEEPATEVEVTPAPAAEQQAVVSSDSSLPFTGFVAIPLLVIGVGLILVGATLRFKSRKDTPAGL
jgi:hypothetical protein